MSKEAMKLALEALIRAERDGYWSRDTSIAGEALREALAEQPAQQEPKFVRNVGGIPCITLAEHEHLMRSRPQAREPLTDEQIDRLWSQSLADTKGETYLPLREFARAIESAHGIKENT